MFGKPFISERKYMRVVITLLVPDRIGILSEITGTVTDLGADIESISQTVVAGYFTVTLGASFSKEKELTTVSDSIRKRFGGDTSVIGVVPYTPPAVNVSAGEHYVVTFMGPDQPGILKSATSFLASRHINIDDWFFILSPPDVTHVGEITVPTTLDFVHLQNELSVTMRDFGLTTSIQHENIFRATNEIGPIKSLLKEGYNV